MNPVVPDQCQTVLNNAAHFLKVASGWFVGNDVLRGEPDRLLEQYAECLCVLGSLTCPSNHPFMVNIYLILAIPTANQGKHVQAITYYEKALAACESSLDKTNSNYTFILRNMAVSFFIHIPTKLDTCLYDVYRDHLEYVKKVRSTRDN
ncbi:unnamed protein product [Rotaria sp. Silwood2]|nr:unnamed protein product [Rotaria sp. Silwood2]